MIKHNSNILVQNISLDSYNTSHVDGGDKDARNVQDLVWKTDDIYDW